jgi:hypothetical protein
MNSAEVEYGTESLVERAEKLEQKAAQMLSSWTSSKLWEGSGMLVPVWYFRQSDQYGEYNNLRKQAEALRLAALDS